MHSDVENRAAARPVGEARHTASSTACQDRVSLWSLSHRGERTVMRISSAGNPTSAGFQSHV